MASQLSSKRERIGSILNLRHSRGEFWEGGKSFPSGHSAASFAFASVLTHRYPHNPWVRWGAYALATGVSLGRLAGKKHFPSDVLVGATVGYVTGAYLADHSRK
jgi:membrane-associated phospholipid phosphatase